MPPAPSRAYHHGDLRQALLDAAVSLLRSGGPAALTLRAVAREAGVSQTAPYRHFADRQALVAGVAESGFRDLYDEMIRAAAGSIGDKNGLQRIALAYVRFAMEHPAEYRVMFGHEVVDRSAHPALREAGGTVFALLRNGIAHLQAAGAVRAGSADAMAVTCWSLVHGLVTLALDQQGPPGALANVEALATTATGLLMIGLAAPSSAVSTDASANDRAPRSRRG